ncbi:MAG: hypothetical protein IJZ29_04205 [Clostridia bacterium]|nr:hypothetical protein [Clostridia bacterium]
MKKLNKLGTVALSATVMATSVFAGPMAINTVSANTDTTGKIMTIEKLLSTYSCDENGKVTIPKASGSATTEIYPLYSNEAVADTIEVGNSIQFTPQFSAYRVVYAINGIEKEFVINIELTKPVLSLQSNSEVYLPSTSEKDYGIIIPYPEVADEDGDALKNLNGEEYTKAELASKTSIKVYAPNGTLLSATEPNADKPIGTITESNQTYVDTIKYLTFTPKAFGTYTIKYTFQADTTTQAELTKEVNVVNAFENDRDLSFTLSKSLGTPVIGEEFTLPTPIVNDNTNDLEDIEAYTEITVKCIKEDGTSVPVTVDGFKFTPLVEGDYIVTYKVSDLYGNIAPIASYQISNVKDTKAPFNIKLVDSYEFTDTNLEDLEDYSYALQSRMKTSVDGDEETYLIIPAVYAKDNDPNNTLENLQVTRTIKASYSSSASAITVSEPFNEVAKIKIDSASTYTVTYTIYDKVEGNKAEVSYQVVVQDNYADEIAPEITFDTAVPTSAKAGETITFKKPTAVDYRDANKNTGDTRLELKTYWYADNNVNDKQLISANENDATKLSLTIDNETTASTITILTICTDDAGNVSEVEKVVTIVNDTTAPEFAQVGDFEASYTQGSVITIPSVTISDNYVNSVSANIEVTNELGERVLVNGITYTADANNVVVSGASFYAVQSGEYQIKYVLRDGSDNVSIFTHSINVTRTSAPIIKVDTDLITAELGDEVDLNIFTAYDDGRQVDPSEIVISGVSVDNNNKFVAQSIGNYTVTFTYNYEEASVQKSVTKTINVNVQDTTKPTISFDTETFNDTAYKPNVEITLPTPVVTDNSNQLAGYEVKVTIDSDEITVTENKFTPVKEGTYTITYTATDVHGNSDDKVFTIVVGDKTGPVIDLGDESVNAPATMKKGSTLTLDTSKITIYDEYENENITVSKTNTNVTITLRGPDGNAVDNTSPNGYSWKLDKVGTYTLTYVAKDSNGNRTTITKNIEVADEVIEESNVGDTGMVLAIIAALAVLAGVIIFFFKPEKKTKGNKNKKVTK